jgi:hypothetical protein
MQMTLEAAANGLNRSSMGHRADATTTRYAEVNLTIAGSPHRMLDPKGV